jgi:3-oxoadipate enol-lactonase
MQKELPLKTFETSDGCAIAFTVCPARKPAAPRIVLIHSLALDGSIWAGVTATLAGQAEILTYDCRGHGRSCREAIPFTAELFARDLAELLDHVGWQSTAVAGCSMGGCVAQAFAGLYSTRINALGLIDTTAWYGQEAPKTWRERAAAARSKGLAALTECQATRWFGDHFRATHPEVIQAMNQIFLATDMDCYAATCIMLGDADLRPHLPSLRMPVAVVVGEEDYATPLVMARQLHEAIPDSTLTILPGARHLTPIECPEEIAAQLLALLQRAGSVRGAQA